MIPPDETQISKGELDHFLLGSHDLKRKSNGSLTIKYSKKTATLITHPLFNSTQMEKGYDIGMIKLKKAIKLSASIKIICMVGPQVPWGIEGVFIAGWGKTEKEGHVINDPDGIGSHNHLMMAKTKVISIDDHLKIYQKITTKNLDVMGAGFKIRTGKNYTKEQLKAMIKYYVKSVSSSF